MPNQQHQKINQLALNAISGDHSAFSELYRETWQAQYFTILSIIKDSSAAEDILQLTYLQALQYIGNLSSPAGFLSWLTRIAYNNCMDFLKKNSRLSAELNATPPAEQTDSDLDRDPFNRAFFSENHAFLMGILDELTLEHRTVILLRYFQDLKIKEIAHIMDISEGTVRSRIHYALRKMKRKMNARGYYGADSLMGVGVLLSRSLKPSEAPNISYTLKSGRQNTVRLTAAAVIACLLVTAAGISSSGIPTAAIDSRSDHTPPVVDKIAANDTGLFATVSDDLSGVDYDSIRAVQNKRELTITSIDQKNRQISLPCTTDAPVYLTLTDHSGNGKTYRLSFNRSYSLDVE